MATLVFDIETIGEDFDAMDETTQEVLLRWAKQSSTNDEDLKMKTEEVRDGLGFSPFTGEIVAIGVLDMERDRTMVLYQAPGIDTGEIEEDGVKYRPMSEKEMLEEFWRIAEQYDTFVTFNGRGFDAPWLAIRSAVHKIRPTRDLLSNRYTSLQRGVKHIDVMDQLTFYGATMRRPNLHIVCRAFGVKSPKADGVNGDCVAALFKEGQYLDIARYNVGDLRSTRDVYQIWKKYIGF